VSSTPDPVLLLHGQPGGARDWHRVVEAIAGRTTTIMADRPGWDGHSAATDLAGNARAATALLDAQGIARATIVGHSFGGAVACWLAAHAPERVSALVLAAPSANAASLYRVDRWLAAPVAGPIASAASLAATGVALHPHRARRRLAARLGVDESYLEESGRVLRTRSAWRSFVTEQRVLVSQLPDLESRLGDISAPTAIVVGTEDRVVAPRAARQLAAEIPGARLSLVDGAGHLLPLLAPGPLAELILDSSEHHRRHSVSAQL
jgi:pimeloyl-ACP methyl ester carboxylesterase